MTRPKDLIHAVDELPPWPRLIFLGRQCAALMSVYLVLIVQAIWQVQSARAISPTGIFGDLHWSCRVRGRHPWAPAVFAMTIFAAAVELALAPLLSRLLGLFPPTIYSLISPALRRPAK
jgi:xanthine/uracil permease